MKFRIYRNAEACFYGKDLEQTDLHYTDAWFEKLREHGFTGFWLNIWMPGWGCTWNASSILRPPNRWSANWQR